MAASRMSGDRSRFSNSSEERSVFSRAFFIFDEYHMDESAPDDEIMLYFFPPETALEQQLDIMGAAKAMMAFTHHNFSQAQTKVYHFENTKMTEMRVGEYILVLTGRMTHSDDTLVSALELLWDAFQFYNGSLESIQTAALDRKGLQQEVYDRCLYLVPLLTTFHSSGLPLHRAIQQTPLAKTSTRYFVEASQLLSQLTTEFPWVLAGCILYNYSVVCSHMDIQTTRWIFNLTEALDRNDELRTQPNGILEDTIYEYPTSVYITQESLRELYNEKLRLLKSYRPSLSESASLPTEDKPDPIAPWFEDDTIKDTEMRSVGLYVVSLMHISLALIGNLDFKQDDDKQLNKIRAIANSKLYNLERTFTKSELEIVRSDPSAPIKLARSETMNGDDGFAMGSNLKNSVDKDTRNYNFLCFNELTENQSGYLGIRSGEARKSFSTAVNSAHDMFRDKSIKKLILRDHTGSVHCCHSFGRETFFQVPSPGVAFERIEERARSTLYKDHNITLI